MSYSDIRSAPVSYTHLQMMLSGLYDRFRDYEEKRHFLQRRREIYSQMAGMAGREPGLDLDSLISKFTEQYEAALRVKDEHRLISEEDCRRDEKAGRFFGAARYRLKAVSYTHLDVYKRQS